MRISRVSAFEAQGVTLRYPGRSWSGTRGQDGNVVMAIREHDVQVQAEGFSCLLWSPVIEGATEWVDRPMKHERLGHCRLAMMSGGAAGLLVHAASGEVEPDAVLALRIEKRDHEYWATWGAASRALPRSALTRSRAAPIFEPARMAA